MYTVTMDNDQQNMQPVELPGVQASEQSAITLPVGVAPVTERQGPVQQAIVILMNTTKSPFQMSTEFAKLKEDYLAQTYGVTIE